MKLIRVEWPKVRERAVKGKNYYTVDLRRAGNNGAQSKTFSTKELAIEFARGIASKINKSGFDSLNVNQDPRMKQWQEQSALLDMTVDEVFAFAISTLQAQRKAKNSSFMSGLLSEWVLDKSECVLKPLRPATLRGIRSTAGLLKKDFGDIRIEELTRKQIEDYLSAKKGSNRYRDNIRNYLHQFCNWCIKKEYLKFNPAAGIEITIASSGMPRYFSVDQSKNIMLKAMEEPSVVCYFALALFGGIRPQEIERMEWSNINLFEKHIVLPATITKTKSSRQFEINSTLLAWLSAYKTEKPLIPELLRQKKETVTDMFDGDWINDGLRHTYATFHYGLHHSLDELKHTMGNSPGVINKFYRGNVDQKYVQQFWAITPETMKAV